MRDKHKHTTDARCINIHKSFLAQRFYKPLGYNLRFYGLAVELLFSESEMAAYANRSHVILLLELFNCILDCIEPPVSKTQIGLYIIPLAPLVPSLQE